MGRLRPGVALALSLTAVALLGLLVSVQPFTGDQALFASGARQLAHGDVLYRDVWDVKQPGIYLWYLVGGATVGYGETALHLFEVATLLAFGLFLGLSTRDRFGRPWIAALVPLFVVGTYFATAEPLQLGQVESLAGIPIYLALWCGVRARNGSRSWLVAAGVAGGVALVFKLALAPVVAAVWIVAIVPGRDERGPGSARRLARDGCALLAGAALPIAATLAYLASHDQLETVRWTFFEVTPRATGLAGRPVRRLLDGGVRTAARWALPLALAVVGAWHARRRGWDRLEVGLLAWTVTAVPVLLVQHWWIYQYALVLPPIGVFAAAGVDAIVERRPSRRVIVALGIGAVVLAIPLGLRVASNTQDLATHGFGRTPLQRRALHADAEPHYREALAWARHLRGTPTPRGIYVLGNPLDVYVAGRRQSVAINGWSPEQYPPSVWRELRHQLSTAQPDEIVVDDFSTAIMRERSPATLRLVHRQYRRVGGRGPDTWYRRRADDGPPPARLDESSEVSP